MDRIERRHLSFKHSHINSLFSIYTVTAYSYTVISFHVQVKGLFAKLSSSGFLHHHPLIHQPILHTAVGSIKSRSASHCLQNKTQTPQSDIQGFSCTVVIYILLINLDVQNIAFFISTTQVDFLTLEFYVRQLNLDNFQVILFKSSIFQSIQV